MTGRDRAMALTTLSMDLRIRFRAERAELDRLYNLDRDADQAWHDEVVMLKDRHNRTRDQILAMVQVCELLQIN